MSPNRSLLVAVGLMAAGHFASAAVLTLNPVTDGYIRSTGGSMSNTSMLVGKTATSNDYLNGLLAFDFSSLPEHAVIESISLSVFSAAVDGSSVATTFSLYDSLRNFASNATWSNYATGSSWATPGGTGAADRGALVSSLVINPSTATRGAKFVFASSAAFVAAANAAYQNGEQFSLWLGTNPADVVGSSRHVLWLETAEGSQSIRPTLSITYTVVPESSSLIIVAMGMGVLGFCHRRERVKIS